MESPQLTPFASTIRMQPSNVFYNTIDKFKTNDSEQLEQLLKQYVTAREDDCDFDKEGAATDEPSPVHLLGDPITNGLRLSRLFPKITSSEFRVKTSAMALFA